MSNEEANKVLEELHDVRPEKLDTRAKRLFEAIMVIANGRDKAEADLYEANNRIVDLMDIIDERDEIIDLMANEIYIEYNPHFNTVEDVKKFFEERCNNG